MDQGWNHDQQPQQHQEQRYPYYTYETPAQPPSPNVYPRSDSYSQASTSINSIYPGPSQQSYSYIGLPPTTPAQPVYLDLPSSTVQQRASPATPLVHYHHSYPNPTLQEASHQQQIGEYHSLHPQQQGLQRSNAPPIPSAQTTTTSFPIYQQRLPPTALNVYTDRPAHEDPSATFKPPRKQQVDPSLAGPTSHHPHSSQHYHSRQSSRPYAIVGNRRSSSSNSDQIEAQKLVLSSHIQPSLASEGAAERSEQVAGPSQTPLASAAGPHRKRIAQSACETCRRKRTKCIIESGNTDCTTCRNLNLECVFSGIDKRKESVRELRARLAQLESLFEKLQSVEDEQLSALVSAIKRNELDIDNGPLSASSVQSERSGIYTSSGRATDATKTYRTISGDEVTTDEGSHWNVDIPDDPVEEGMIGHAMSTVSSTSKAFDRHQHPEARPNDARQEGMESKDEATLSELTDRLTMTEDGSLRAVSAVSSLCLDTKPNAVRKSTKSTSSTNGKGSSPLPSSVQSLTSETEAMNEIRLGTHVLVPEGTTAHTIVDLLNIFFLWESSVHPLISRPAFLEHMAHGGRYFSPLLHNAMLACACQLSGATSLRTDPAQPAIAGESFFRLADKMLADELDGAYGPTGVPITTIQALALLASYLYATGRELKAWIHMGTCARMALDSGLHLDASAFVYGEGSTSRLFTEDDLYVRSRTFWGIWLLEQEFCSLFGRAGIMRDIIVTCPSFEIFDTRWSRSEDFNWTKSLQAHSIQPLDAKNKGLESLWPHARQMANLMMHSMHLIYYRVANRAVEGKVDRELALDKIMRKTAQLVAKLPPIQREILRQEEHATDQVMQAILHINPMLLTIHLKVHSHIILMNRPFYERIAGQTLPATASSSTLEGDSPRTRCLKSAARIVELLNLWQRAWTEDLVTAGNGPAHILLASATVYLHELASNSKSLRRRSSTKEQSNIPDSAREKCGSASLPFPNPLSLYPEASQTNERRAYGRSALEQYVLPLLERMSHNQSAPQRQLRQLRSAMKEFDTSIHDKHSAGRQGRGRNMWTGASHIESRRVGTHREPFDGDAPQMRIYQRAAEPNLVSRGSVQSASSRLSGDVNVASSYIPETSQQTTDHTENTWWQSSSSDAVSSIQSQFFDMPASSLSFWDSQVHSDGHTGSATNDTWNSWHQAPLAQPTPTNSIPLMPHGPQSLPSDPASQYIRTSDPTGGRTYVDSTEGYAVASNLALSYHPDLQYQHSDDFSSRPA